MADNQGSSPERVSDERLAALIQYGAPGGLAPHDFMRIVRELQERRAREVPRWRGYCECRWDSARSRVIEPHPACQFHARERIDALTSNERGKTHWDGCWRTTAHHACAVEEIERLTRERDEARKGEATSDRIALHWQTKAEQLRTALRDWCCSCRCGWSAEIHDQWTASPCVHCAPIRALLSGEPGSAVETTERCHFRAFGSLPCEKPKGHDGDHTFRLPEETSRGRVAHTIGELSDLMLPGFEALPFADHGWHNLSVRIKRNDDGSLGVHTMTFVPESFQPPLKAGENSNG